MTQSEGRPAEGLDGFSPPVAYTRAEVQAATDEPGVHVVWGPDGEVLYVGRSGAQRERLLQHLSGGRGSSVLHQKVGALLDEELGTRASTPEIQSYLGTCRVSWRTSEDPVPLQVELIRSLDPVLNERMPGGSRSDPSQASLHLVLRWRLEREPQTVTLHRDLAEAQGSVWWGKFGSAPGPSAKTMERLRRQVEEGIPTFVFLHRTDEVWRARLRQIERGDFAPDRERVPAYYGDDDVALWVRLSDFEPLAADWPERNLRFAQGGREGDAVDFRGRNSMLLVTIGADVEGDEGPPDSRAEPVLVGLVRRVLELQAVWVADAPLPALDERVALVGRRIPDRLRGLVGDGWEVAGDLMRRPAARVPWVRISRPGQSSTPTQGWHAVVLFAADGSAAYLSLNHGVQQPAGAAAGARARLDRLGAIPSGSTAEIELRDPGGKGDAYELGNVFAFRYPAAALPSEGELAAHLALTLDALDLIHQGADTVPSPPFDLELLRRHVEAPGRALDLPDEVLLAVLAAVRSGKHIVLTGPPGTAKTTLAEAVADAAAEAGLCEGYVLTTATSDWTTFETVGGLRPVDGALEFVPGQFVEAIRDDRWLVVDEMNRANFDRAFGQLFTLLSGQTVSLPYTDPSTNLPIKLARAGSVSAADGSSHVIELADSWRLLATMNVFDKSLLFEMSFALMRRFAFIEVGAPRDAVYRRLIAERLRGLPDDHEAMARAALKDLLALRSIKELGPALFIDMALFARERVALGDIDGPTLTYQLFYSYLLPQFEGIDDGTARDLVKQLGRSLDGDLRKRLRRDLQQVLGVELPSPVSAAGGDEGFEDDPDGP